MELHNQNNCAPDASVCTALAVGDVIVSCSVSIVIVLLLLLLLGPLFFRFVWRPLRIRQFLQHRREAHKRRLIMDGRPKEEVDNYAKWPVHLSFSQHKHLHMDEDTSKYSFRAMKKRAKNDR